MPESPKLITLFDPEAKRGPYGQDTFRDLLLKWCRTIGACSADAPSDFLHLLEELRLKLRFLRCPESGLIEDLELVGLWFVSAARTVQAVCVDRPDVLAHQATPSSIDDAKVELGFLAYDGTFFGLALGSWDSCIWVVPCNRSEGIAPPLGLQVQVPFGGTIGDIVLVKEPADLNCDDVGVELFLPPEDVCRILHEPALWSELVKRGFANLGVCLHCSVVPWEFKPERTSLHLRFYTGGSGAEDSDRWYWTSCDFEPGDDCFEAVQGLLKQFCWSCVQWHLITGVLTAQGESCTQIEGGRWEMGEDRVIWNWSMPNAVRIRDRVSRDRKGEVQIENCDGIGFSSAEKIKERAYALAHALSLHYQQQQFLRVAC